MKKRNDNLKLVPRAGIEPARPCSEPRILSPMTMPPDISEKGIFSNDSKQKNEIHRASLKGQLERFLGTFSESRGKNAGNETA